MNKLHEGKKEEEVPTAEKDEKEEISKKLTELKGKKTAIYTAFAAKDSLVHQLIDLALLQNNMLKGESLNNFVKRSIDMIK